MKKTISNTLKRILVLIVFITSQLISFAQDAVPAVAGVKEEIPVEDTRTIAEWSSLTGTQIFAMLILIMFIQIVVVITLSDVIKNLLKSDKFKNRLKNGLKTIAILIGISFTLHPATASAAPVSPEAKSIIQLSDSMFWALVTVNAILLLVILYLLNFMKWILREMNPIVNTEALRDTWWTRFMSKMTDAVPVEKEDAVLTDHEYDGIRELDNNLPPWWVYGFYITIAFAFVYLFHFHVFKTGDLQTAEYEKEMKKAQEEVDAYLKSQADNVDEFTATLLTDAGDLAEGKTIFIEKCAQCHRADGGGQIGPNLTDDYWIHGGDIKDVFKSVKYGIPSKSMQSWKDQLTPKQIHKVASYIKSLKGSNPANAKAPEGDLFSEDGKATTPAEKTTETDTLTVNDTIQQ